MKKIILLAVLSALVPCLHAQTIINTFAGNGAATSTGDGGIATAASLNYLFAGCVDDSGNVYITDVFSNRIRKVNAYTGIISTVAGNGTSGYTGDGLLATNAELNEPEGIAVDTAGNLYIGDSYNHVVRKVTKSTGIITTIAGNGSSGSSGDGGQATSATFDIIIGVAVDDSGNVYIANHYNAHIRKVTAATGIITTIAGGGANAGTDGVGDGGPATGASLNQPDGVAVDGSGNVYIADQWHHIVRKVTKTTGIITCIAGTANVSGYTGDNGQGTAAELDVCSGVAVDAAGNVFIADTYNNVIREVTKSTGIITTIAGNGYDQNTGNGAYAGDGGPATAAELNLPNGVAVDACDNVFSFESDNRARLIYVPDSVKVTPDLASTCGGSNTKLKASGANVYAWSPSTGLSATSGDSVIANPTVATTYYVTGVSSCSGWLTIVPDSAVFTIGGSLSISVTPDSPSVCNGQTITLKASGGTTYQWVGTSDATDSINVHPAKDTTYQLMASNGGCSKDTLIAVKVNTPKPLSSQSQNVCSGSSVILTVPVSGSNYVWSPDSTLNTYTGDTVIASPTSNIIYTVTGLDSLGCMVSTNDTVNIIYGPNKPTITISVTGDSLISSAGSYNQWYFNGSPINNATGQVLVITGHPHGYYKVVVTNPANGCGTTSDSTTSIHQLSVINSQLSIYPNPTNGTVFIKINSAASNVNEWSLQLTDVLGRTVFTNPSLGYSNELDLSNLPAGVYFITVKNNTASAVYKIVKQN